MPDRLSLMLWPPEKLLSLTYGDSSRGSSEKLLAFTLILFFHLAARNIARFLEWGEHYRFYLACVFLLSFFCTSTNRLRRFGVILACIAACLQFVWTFPTHSNHFFLEWLCVVIITMHIFSHGDEARRNTYTIAAIKWLLVFVLLASGIQKLLYGTYFRGTFLAYRIAHLDMFDHFFRLILPTEEFTTLNNPSFSGPYVLHSPLGLLLSNSIPILEIASAVFLLKKRYLRMGIALAFVLLVAMAPFA